METNATNRGDGGLLNETRSFGKLSSVLPFMTTIKVCTGVTGLVGNSLVVFVMYKYRKLFTNVKTIYLINQSVLDGLASAVLILASQSRMESVSADLFCRPSLSQIPLLGLMTSSTYNLMAISVERYLAIVHPMWHRTSFTQTKIRSSIVAIWLFGIIDIIPFMVPTTGIYHRMCFPSYFWPSREVAIAVGVLQIFVNIVMPIVVHGVCYARILITLIMRMTSVQDVFSTTVVAGVSSVSEGTIACTSTNENGNARVSCLHRSCQQTPGGELLHIGSTAVKVKRSSATSDTDLAAHKVKLSSGAAQAARVPNNQGSDCSKQNMKATKNVIKSLAIVTACFFVYWLPRKVYVYLYMLGITYVGFLTRCTFICICLVLHMLASSQGVRLSVYAWYYICWLPRKVYVYLYMLGITYAWYYICYRRRLSVDCYSGFP